MSGPMDALKKGMAELYKSGYLTDIEIVCGGQTFKVHKAILCAHSKHWHTPCGQDFAEGSNGRIELKAIGEGEDDDACDDPGAIKLMVHYFYHLDYEVDSTAPAAVLLPSGLSGGVLEGSVPGNNPFLGSSKKSKKGYSAFEPPPVPQAAPMPNGGNMVTHARVFAVATKYFTPALQELASNKFAAAARNNWDHHTFAEAARIAYSTTPDVVRALRDTVSQVIHGHKTLLDKTSVEAVVSSNPDLHFELLRLARGLPAVAEKQVDGRESLCANCGSWMYFQDCDFCSRSYKACCGQCDYGCV
ncbi:hypothetical protein LTR53_000130 [Teratosphaeriaceae sp. CCFEE 6253]|nr:hypothetical protein LTR53_000130 [Teratosphaeriaceae sp. CCFEE 6253]